MVLVAGGANTILLATVELYDPSTGIWTPTSNMNSSHGTHNAELIHKNVVLVIGGGNTISELYHSKND